MRNATIHRSRRRQRGAILAETAAAAIMLAMVLVAGTMLFLCVGIYCVYKIKMGFVCNNIVRNAAGCYAWNRCVIPPDIQGIRWQQPKAVELANTLLPGVGLPQVAPSNLQLNDDGTTLTMTMTVTGFVYPFGTQVGMPIYITDIASADLTGYQPPALCQLRAQSDPQLSWLLPCYGDAATAAPNLNMGSYHVFKLGIPGDVQYSVSGP